MTNTRYTRKMGPWPIRLTSLVLVVLLGGGSALASVCESLCSETAPAHQSAETVKMPPSHHHGAAAAQPERSSSAVSTHHHDGEDGGASARLNAGKPAMSLSCTNCCNGLVRPRTSLAADRADTGLILRPLLVATLSIAPIAQPDRDTLRPWDSSPPGASLLSRPVVVLRI